MDGVGWGESGANGGWDGYERGPKGTERVKTGAGIMSSLSSLHTHHRVAAGLRPVGRRRRGDTTRSGDDKRRGEKVKQDERSEGTENERRSE